MTTGWFTEIRGRVPRVAAILLGLIPIIASLALWAFLTHGPREERRISVAILPSPGEVWDSIPQLFERRHLVDNTLASLRRIGLSFAIALAVALPLGILMGAFGSASSTFSPVVTASGYIPIASLVPLTMSWWGIGEEQKVYFLALAFIISLLPLVIKAVDGVPDVFLKTAYTLGAGRLQSVFKILIPIALPDLWHGMRLSFGVGWTYLVLAEVVVLDKGLGYLVGISQRQGPREHIYLVIILIAILAFIFDLVWVTLGNLLFPYRRRAA